MRRLLLILLMFVLPLQWSWAAAASFCTHESDASVSHFGHHLHKHDGAKAGADQADGAAHACASDCGICHGVGAAFVAVLNELPVPRAVPIRFDTYEPTVPNCALGTLFRPPCLLVS